MRRRSHSWVTQYSARKPCRKSFPKTTVSAARGQCDWRPHRNTIFTFSAWTVRRRSCREETSYRPTARWRAWPRTTVRTSRRAPTRWKATSPSCGRWSEFKFRGCRCLGTGCKDKWDSAREGFRGTWIFEKYIYFFLFNENMIRKKDVLRTTSMNKNIMNKIIIKKINIFVQLTPIERISRKLNAFIMFN